MASMPMGSIFSGSQSTPQGASPSAPIAPSPQPSLSIGGQGPDPSATPNPEMSAARQLIGQVATIHSSLKELASTYPELGPAANQAMQILQTGMTKAIQGMRNSEGEGTSPSYA